LGGVSAEEFLKYSGLNIYKIEKKMEKKWLEK